DLIGCRVETTAAVAIGVVTDVEGTMAGSRLVIDGGPAGGGLATPGPRGRRGNGGPGENNLCGSPGGVGRLRRADRATADPRSAMTFDIVTIFPAMIEQPLMAGIIGRAIDRGMLDVKVHDLRDFTTDRHRVVDDVPYGGGPGMVLKADPIFRALDAIEAARGRP